MAEVVWDDWLELSYFIRVGVPFRISLDCAARKCIRLETVLQEA
ncbi:hypothetical protein VDG1235_3561 [Verrucomicrobiia bacterium DG1235]|nr:hypothetical protein VDG1235_3561 [Verrucomicrobiae bacterium DG1235]